MQRSSQARSREGSTAILVMFAMVVIIGVAAHAIDAGQLYKVRTELQNGADAAALVGAKMLDGTADGMTTAEEAIIAYSEANNHAYGGLQGIQADDIEFGHWSTVESTFTPYDEDGGNPADANAVRVVARRDGAAGTVNVGTPFGDFLGPGNPGEEVSAVAIAVGGGPVTECGFPMVVGSCQLDELDMDVCEFCFVNQGATDDTFGWTSFTNNVGSAHIAEAIADACFADPESPTEPIVDSTTHECMGACGNPIVEEEIDVTNGNILQPNEQDNNPCELIRRILLRNDPDDPEYFTVRVPVIASDDCPAVDYLPNSELDGWASMDIWGVSCGNGGGGGGDPGNGNGQSTFTGSGGGKGSPKAAANGGNGNGGGTGGTSGSGGSGGSGGTGGGGSGTPVIDTDHPDYAAGLCTPPPSEKYVLGSLRCDLVSSEVGGGGFGNGLSTTRPRLVQ